MLGVPGCRQGRLPLNIYGLLIRTAKAETWIHFGSRYTERISVVFAHGFAIPRFGLYQLIPHQCERIDVFKRAGCVNLEGSIPAVGSSEKRSETDPICGCRFVLTGMIGCQLTGKIDLTSVVRAGALKLQVL